MRIVVSADIPRKTDANVSSFADSRLLPAITLSEFESMVSEYIAM